MIKKFNEFIEEGFLSKTINRTKTGEERLENNNKYKTSLGVDIEVSCSNDDVEEIIEFILNSEEDEYRIQYSTEGGDLEVGFDGQDKVYITYPDYSEIEYEFEDLTEEDYSAITTCIGTAIKENVGKYTNILVSRSEWGFAILLEQDDMDEIEEGWDEYKNLLGNWIKDKENYKTNTGFDLGEWSEWKILLNYEVIANFPEIYKDVQECLKKWREEYNDDEDEEE